MERRRMIQLAAAAVVGLALPRTARGQSDYLWLGPTRATDEVVSPRHGIILNTQTLQFLPKKQKARSLARLASMGITNGLAVDVLNGIRSADLATYVDQCWDDAVACIGGAASIPAQIIIEPGLFWSPSNSRYAAGATDSNGVIRVVGLYVGPVSHGVQCAWRPDGTLGSLIRWECENWAWLSTGHSDEAPHC